jgi:hypothetical protein
MEGGHGRSSTSIDGGHGELSVRGGKGKRGEQQRVRLSVEEEEGGACGGSWTRRTWYCSYYS